MSAGSFLKSEYFHENNNTNYYMFGTLYQVQVIGYKCAYNANSIVRTTSEVHQWNSSPHCINAGPIVYISAKWNESQSSVALN